MITNFLLSMFLLNMIGGAIAEIPCPLPAGIIFAGAETAPVPPTFILLYTRRNPYNPQNFTFTNCTENTYFNPNLKTVILSDGLNGKPTSEHITFLVIAYLHYEDCNVLVVDWSIAAADVLNAIRNALIIGKYVAQQLEYWKENCPKINFDNFHVIGFSLGGQMVAFIGKYMKTGKIGRITGIDIAGICYVSFPPMYKLHYTDAKFVDVISVSSFTQFLLEQPTGHVHFYPDGGKIRKGCGDSLAELDKRMAYECSHFGAVYLFIATFYSKCLPVGYQCSDQDTFNKGECYDCGEDGKKCAAMGIHADKYADKITNETAKMYLVTTSTDDYCLYQYHVEVTLALNTNSTTEVGKLALIINNGTVNAILNENLRLQYETDDFQSGRTYTFLISTTQNVDEITQLEFLWYSTTPRIDNRLYIQCVKIVPMNNLEIDRSSLTTYGTTDGEAIPPYYTVSLHIGSRC